METVKVAPKVAAVEIPLYIEMTNKNGFIYKIANHDNPKVCPQSGIIIIEALKRSEIKQPRISFKKLVDPETGITYGIPLGINNTTGEIDFQRIELGDMTQFDCANVSDRKLWTIISRHESMMGSPFQRGVPKFKKVDKNAEASKIISNSKLMVRAVQIAQDMNGVELYDMALNLGLSADHNNNEVLLSNVVEMATKKPAGFLAVYDNTNRNVITVFNRARAVGLIKLDVMSGYTWKDTFPLGTNDTMAIKTIVGNPALLMNMDLESKQRSNFYTKNATPEDLAAVKLNKEQYNKNEGPKADDGFMTDKDINVKIQELEVERERSKTLNDKMQAFLDQQDKIAQTVVTPIDYDSYKIYTIDELKDKALEAGFALAKTVEDRKALIREIVKRKK